jgi:hypothetical protein
VNEAPLQAEPASPKPERLPLKVRVLAYWNHLRLKIKSRRRVRLPKPPKQPLSPKVKEDRIQWAVYSTFTAGWMLATWGVVLASGWAWLWPISGGAFLMWAARLVFLAMVEEEKRRQQSGR